MTRQPPDGARSARRARWASWAASVRAAIAVLRDIPTVELEQVVALSSEGDDGETGGRERACERRGDVARRVDHPEPLVALVRDDLGDLGQCQGHGIDRVRLAGDPDLEKDRRPGSTTRELAQRPGRDQATLREEPDPIAERLDLA